jgi:hypothetical protein
VVPLRHTRHTGTPGNAGPAASVILREVAGSTLANAALTEDPLLAPRGPCLATHSGDN